MTPDRAFDTISSIMENRQTGKMALMTAMLFCIAVFAFYINRDIEIKGLYMDDLYMWSCYGEQSFFEFVFPIGTSTRFRPVYWLFTYIQMAIIGSHVDWFASFNIICNIIVAYELFYICRKLSKSLFLPFMSSICYLASRFAYYQIGQALGLMETLAQFFALWILYLLIVYMQRPNDTTKRELIDRGEAELAETGEKPVLSLGLKRSWDIYFFGALVLYVLLCFTHERYLCLLPLFYLALAVKWIREPKAYKKAYILENRGKWLAPVVVFAAIMLIRMLSTGALVPAGTGGTEVTETFSLASTLAYVWDQICYIFGVNAGENYLAALSWQETPELIQALVKVSIVMIGIIVIMFLVTLMIIASGRDTGDKKRLFEVLSDILMMLCFIGLCIGASSVTIRVEMRWIYVSYSAALILACYMISAIREAYGSTDGKTGLFYGMLCGVFAVYCGLSIYTNAFYRGYFGNLYFWPDQLRMNSLAEQTIESYGVDGVLGKPVYIIGNSYGMSDFYAETFFKPFDPEKTGQGTRIYFVEDETEIPDVELSSGELIVLEEVPEENAYRDITAQIMSRPCSSFYRGS